MRQVLVTGAQGFLGSALCAELDARGLVPRRASRTAAAGAVAVGAIDGATDWRAALAGVGVVVHTAARVHVMREQAADPLAAFRQVNVAGTLNLACQAAQAGVRRFVFISSIKVNGETSAPGRPFTPDDAADPQDPYGISKHEAEQGLRALAAATGMAVVIVRPPLVYGPGVKGNFLSMMRWLRRGVPLPFGAIDNRRSLVALDNLVDLIICCASHAAAANQIFLVSDDEDLSTADLLRRTARALGRPARLIPVPAALMRAAAALAGRGALGQRLCGCLQVDISKTKQLLGWKPLLDADEGLRRAARGFSL